jgi:hypothetical protein
VLHNYSCAASLLLLLLATTAQQDDFRVVNNYSYTRHRSCCYSSRLQQNKDDFRVVNNYRYAASLLLLLFVPTTKQRRFPRVE